MIFHYDFPYKMAINFRENLRNELNFQNVTVKELSARTGIPIATLDCYLGARETVPSVDAAYKIAQALQISIEYLISGESSGSTNPSKKKISQEARNVIKWIENLNAEQCKSIYNVISIFNDKKI